MSEKMRRILMTICGVSVCGFSVGMFDFSDFGMDPFQVFAHGVWMKTPLDFGNLYVIVNAIMLIAVFFLDKKKIGLGTLINLFLLGYIADFSSGLFKSMISSPTIVIRAIILVVAVIIMCIGSSLYFTAALGVSTYDAVALMMSEKKKWKFQYCRVGCDLVCVIIGFVLGATVGVGTLFTAFFMGPFIAFFNRTIAIPLRYGKKKAA